MFRILLVLLVLCASVAFAQERDDQAARGHRGERELRQPMVYDAQGKRVGPLEVYSGVNGVYIDIDGDPVFVEVDHKRIGAQFSDALYQWVASPLVPYEAQGCSGSLAVADAGSPTPAMPVREGADVTVYLARKEYSGDVHVFSTKQIDRATGEATCSSTSYDEGDMFWAIRGTYPLTQHYPEPLRVAY